MEEAGIAQSVQWLDYELDNAGTGAVIFEACYRKMLSASKITER